MYGSKLEEFFFTYTELKCQKKKQDRKCPLEKGIELESIYKISFLYEDTNLNGFVFKISNFFRALNIAVMISKKPSSETYYFWLKCALEP